MTEIATAALQSRAGDATEEGLRRGGGGEPGCWEPQVSATAGGNK